MQVTRFDVNGEANSFTYPLYREMAAAGAPFEGLMCTAGGRASFVAGDGGAAESIQVQLVSGNFYQVLGVRPAIGRLISPDDDRQAGAHPVPREYRSDDGDRSVAGGVRRARTGVVAGRGSDDDDRDGVPVGAAF